MGPPESALSLAYKRETDLAYATLASDLETFWWGNVEPLWSIRWKFERTWRAAFLAWVLNRP